MNKLAFRVVPEHGRTFELDVDGVPLVDLLGSKNKGIPYWIIDDDLPSYGLLSPAAESESRIIAVCSCGEYGCGHSRCLVSLANDVVTFTHFDGNCSSSGHALTFTFSLSNYRSVLSEMIRLADEQREIEDAGRPTSQDS